jgi:ribokinase
MTIKDIARLAGVSTSTVSKIMNDKGDGISPETSDRVLKIIKEYNYKPYEGIRSAQKTRSFLIGVLIDGSGVHQGFLTGILETARCLGYSTIACTSKTPEEEYKSLMMMLRHNVDGVIWEPLNTSDPLCATELEKSGIPVLTVGDGSAHPVGRVSFDYQRVGYLAMEALMKFKHRHVLCLTDSSGGKYDRFKAGCEQCMFDFQAPADNLIHHAMDADDNSELVPFSVTGVVCASTKLADRVLEEAGRTNRRIPKYLSVVCLNDAEAGG